MPKKKETIGQKIKRLRDAKKLRQVDLADAIGVSEYTVMRWEGEKATPLEGNARRLGIFFRVPQEEFHSAKTALSPVGKRLDRLEKDVAELKNELLEIRALI